MIVLEADGEVRLVDLPREDYEQPEMKYVHWNLVLVARCGRAGVVRWRGMGPGASCVQESSAWQSSQTPLPTPHPSELIKAVKVESFGPQDYHEEVRGVSIAIGVG